MASNGHHNSGCKIERYLVGSSSTMRDIVPRHLKSYSQKIHTEWLLFYLMICGSLTPGSFINHVRRA